MRIDRHGFTLIEVVGAIVIVSVGIVSILQLFKLGAHSAAYQKDRMIAAYLLQGKMEEIKCMPYAKDLTEPATPFADFPDFIYTVSEASYGAPLVLKEVVVKIAWSTVGWGDHEETLMTLVADR